MIHKILFAYLDPGSGSFVIQIILGGIAAFFFAIKAYWQKIRAVVFKKRNRPDDTNQDKP